MTLNVRKTKPKLDTLGDRIRHLRRAAKMSMGDFARFSGFEVTHISAVETDRIQPSHGFLSALVLAVAEKIEEE